MLTLNLERADCEIYQLLDVKLKYEADIKRNEASLAHSKNEHR
jgi:hypothetical protein